MESRFIKIVIATIIVAFAIFYTMFITSDKENVTNEGETSLVLNGGTYDTDVDVIVTADPDIAFEFVAEHIDSPITPRDFEANGVTFTDEEGRIVVWISDANDRGVVNHELLHAAFSIMMWAGIPLNESTEESYAYELQYLTNQFYNKIK